VETLTRLAADGYRLGVCTNKPRRPSLEVMAALGLAGFFTAVFGGDSLDGIRKPDPRHLLATLEALDATAHESVMVGDNENDVAAAHGAGVRVIAVSFGYAKRPVQELDAEAIIDRFDALPSALARLP
jgi:phosphoglycolate phosphatase